MSGHVQKATTQMALTVWRPQKEGQVRAQKEGNLLRGTHFLVTEQEGTSQAMERMRPREGHSPTVDRRGRDKLGHGKKATWRL